MIGNKLQIFRNHWKDWRDIMKFRGAWKFKKTYWIWKKQIHVIMKLAMLQKLIFFLNERWSSFPPSIARDQGWGLLSQFLTFRYFPNFSSLSKHTLAVKYRVWIWQVSPQLSCGDTCQIWMWFEESNMYFCKIENFAYGEINERSFSNPHPWQHL